MDTNPIDYACELDPRVPNPEKRRRRRRFLLFSSLGAVLVAVAFLWMIWPGPVLWYDYFVDYDNFTFSGVHQTPLLKRQKPIINELYVNGHIGNVSPQHDGTTISRGDWRYVIGKDSPASLAAAGWKVVEVTGDTIATQSGPWGEVHVCFDDGRIDSISVTVNEKKPGVTISNPSFARGKSLTLPCRPEDIVAVFGKPDDERGGFRE